MSLEDVSYASGRMEYRSRHATEPESALAGYLEEARAIIQRAVESYGGRQVEPLVQGPGFEKLRWFALPHEIAAEFQGQAAPAPPAGRLLQL